jgi:hypothetical protein
LESSPLSLEDNVLAQKLKLKLAILIGLEDVSQQVSRHMFVHQMHDEETKALSEALKSSKPETVKDRLIQGLRSHGVEVTRRRRSSRA